MDFDLLDVKNLVATFDPEVPTGDAFLDARYEAHRAEFGHGKPYWRMFWHLCRQFRPGLAVELGGWQGTCAAHMASGGAGMVYTIDHHSDPGDDENQRAMLEAERPYRPRMLYLQGWTWDVVGRVPDGIDLLFIDSWHQYEYAMRDWDLYTPKLANPALVVCDDILFTDGPVIAGMKRFWDEVSAPFEHFLVEQGPHHQVPVGFIKHES
jgi:predicted O-methyltransferase YrrM